MMQEVALLATEYQSSDMVMFNCVVMFLAVVFQAVECDPIHSLPRSDSLYFWKYGRSPAPQRTSRKYISTHNPLVNTKPLSFKRKPHRHQNRGDKDSYKVDGKWYTREFVSEGYRHGGLKIKDYVDKKYRENLYSKLNQNPKDSVSTLVVKGSPPVYSWLLNGRGTDVFTWLIYYKYATDYRPAVLDHHEVRSKDISILYYIIYSTTTTRTTTTPSTTTSSRTTTTTTTTKQETLPTESGAPTAAEADGASVATESGITMSSGATTTAARVPISAAAKTERGWVQSSAPYTTAAAAAALVLCGWWWARRALRREAARRGLPAANARWRPAGALAALYAYPVKSCAGAPLAAAECTRMGLRDNWLRDRFLMVVDERRAHVSSRAHGELLRVRPAARLALLTLHHARMEPLRVNLAHVRATGKLQKAYVCDAPVWVIDCGKEASEWVTRLLRDEHLGTCQLVYYGSVHGRRLRADKQNIFKCARHETGALSNEAPYHLINESSLAALNSRLPAHRAVTALHFRPNFVISGADAFAEDKWKFVRIGESVFKVISPCNRCIMTCVDPDSGVRSTDYEPLSTLRNFRLCDAARGPRMGVQLALVGAPGGVLAAGAPVLAADSEPCTCRPCCPPRARSASPRAAAWYVQVDPSGPHGAGAARSDTCVHCLKKR